VGTQIPAGRLMVGLSGSSHALPNLSTGAVLRGMTTMSRAPHTPARRLRDALEPLAAQGFTSARQPLEALGLSFIPGYVWSRAAALGQPSAAVVVSSFGVFEPTFLAEAYLAGKATASRQEVLAARTAGATQQLEDVLGDDGDVGELGDLLFSALEGISGTARPLFSGLRETPLPETPHGRLWRTADLVREHRGDGHLGACIAAGLEPVEMNVLTELWVGYPLRGYTPTRGHSPEAIDAAIGGLRRRGWLEGDELSDAGAAVRDAIEVATDVAQHELMTALGERLEWAVATASTLSARVVEAGAFTGDERKRAAG
jgi:hypothetical protein